MRTGFLSQACRRAVNARSAFQMILDWDIDVESIRARRAAVEQVAALPVMTKLLGPRSRPRPR